MPLWAFDNHYMLLQFIPYKWQAHNLSEYSCVWWYFPTVCVLSLPIFLLILSCALKINLNNVHDQNWICEIWECHGSDSEDGCEVGCKGMQFGRYVLLFGGCSPEILVPNFADHIASHLRRLHFSQYSENRWPCIPIQWIYLNSFTSYWIIWFPHTTLWPT